MYYNFYLRLSGSDIENMVTKLYSQQFKDSFAAAGINNVVRVLKQAGCRQLQQR